MRAYCENRPLYRHQVLVSIVDIPPSKDHHWVATIFNASKIASTHRIYCTIICNFQHNKSIWTPHYSENDTHIYVPYLFLYMCTAHGQSIKNKQKYRHLVSHGQNVEGWHLVATGGTTCEQDSSRFNLGCWRTWFRQLFEWMYPRYGLNYCRKCLDLLYRWDLIDIKG